MLKRLQAAALWLEKRLHIANLWESTAGHMIPRSSTSWFYVFGSGTLVCLGVQIVTGVLLALIYQPSGGEAFQSLEHLTYVQPLGWMLRAIHYWGSNFMILIMFLHLAQVFLFGAFKFPRELNWISGVFLMLLVFGMGFTGQVLRFDQDAYWGLGIGIAIMGRIPLLGPELVHMLLGGPILGGETLSRFFTLHVFIIPGSIIALVSLHLRLVLTTGINEYPEAGKPVVRETYEKEYEELIHRDGIPFFPDGVGKDVLFSAFVIGLILLFAVVFGPKGPVGLPDPTLIHTDPRPDYPFLWIFAVAALLPDYLETFLILIGPAVAIGLLLVLPFIANTGEKIWSRRPVSVLATIIAVLGLGTLTWLGVTSPWSPLMEAWKSEATPAALLANRTPLERQGALILQNKQCRNCHALDGIGGQRGPDLSKVATRLNREQMIRQIIQGGGNMPAYNKNLSPAEVEALVSYMLTLHPANQPALRETGKTAGL